MILKHESDITTEQGNPVTSNPVQILAVNDKLASVEPFYEPDQTEHGGLAGAGPPGDEDHGALLNEQVYALECLPAGFVTLVNISKLDHGSVDSSAVTNGSAINGARSVIFSPVPMNLSGIPSLLAMANTMPATKGAGQNGKLGFIFLFITFF